ncbi:response regulator transcription factor [Paenibacillus bouchesdurhonensis]|uniref:response regulator transcription factor n=1 Tax=Paenibacillus bouchesdurhonensis TaxID=1870990 RepID=UPI000DA632B4|nr:response regulator [Paenibacillus bouchesdurhonensis]
MLRVLIAEDELPILRGIKRMIEKLNPRFDVVYLAKNGQEAMHYLEDHPIDVVFTDINMPVCDGIELMSYISARHPETYSVVISGYNEFKYVKQAMKYGAKNYILKPVDVNELTELLNILEQQFIKTEYEQRKLQYFNALFNPNQLQEYNQLEPHSFILYVCAGSIPLKISGEEGLAGEVFYEESRLLEDIKRMIGKQDTAWVYHSFSLAEYAVVLQLQDPEKIQIIEEQILSYLVTDDTIPITVVISEEITRMSSMYPIYSQLRRQMYDYSVYGHSSVISKSKNKRVDYILEKEASLRIGYAVKKGNYPLFSDEIVQLKEKLMQFLPSPKNLMHILDQLLLIMHHELEVSEQDSTEVNVNELLTNNYEYDGLFEDFLIVCKDVMNNNGFETQDKDDLMRSVDQYINANLSQNISMKSLSQRFGLVAPYLSKLFKEYKGVSPAQYIQTLRMELAKKMLVENPNMLSKDISEIVGYNDSLYFSKTFKKNVGMYPSEYRMHALSEHQ